MKTLGEQSQEYWLSSEARFEKGIAIAATITDAFVSVPTEHTSQREAAVLKVQFSHQFLPIETDDSFVGRVRYPLVGFSPEPCGLGYYCCADALKTGATQYPGLAQAAHAIAERWQGRTTSEAVRAAYPAWLTERLPSDRWTEDSGVAFPLYRMGGTVLDYERLLALGLDGLHMLLRDGPFAHVVPLMQASIDNYLSETLPAPVRTCLQSIRHHAPQTFQHAIQLFWLYALHAGTWNYGRLDCTLGPFLQRDLNADALTETQALELVCSLWRLMHAYTNPYNHRVIIGGKGRSNEAAADRFAMLAVQATRAVRLNQPQLSLRFYADQDPRLWQAGIDAIGEGCTFPILYNDEVNIPAVARAFEVDADTATHYTPFGCGEYVLGPGSIGSPNGVINLLKALEIALHGGFDPITERCVVPNLRHCAELQTFEQLWTSYNAVVAHQSEALAHHQSLTYQCSAQHAPFAFISAMTPDCAEQNISAFAGGARLLGGTIETYGNTNVSDSFHAIQELVFNQERCTLPELVAALDSDFESAPSLQKACRAVSKYGNDEGTADAMARRVHEHICTLADSLAVKSGLDSYLVVIINNWANTVLGRKTGASADGRGSGSSMANANNPSPGSDTSGVTAFLNSLVKLSPSLHAGSVQNMKFSREWFSTLRPKLEALLRTYFANGGSQAMISVVDPHDLEAAMREPDKWGHLMVRIGGFSMRFVDLPRDAQLEVLQRTLY